MIRKVNIAEALAAIHEQWKPRIAGELNGQQIRLVKIQGDSFEPHVHHNEDEMFFVLHGSIVLEFDDYSIPVNAGEFLIVPADTRHRPIAPDEAHLLMFTKATNINTGDDVVNDFTLDTQSLPRI